MISETLWGVELQTDRPANGETDGQKAKRCKQRGRSLPWVTTDRL